MALRRAYLMTLALFVFVPFSARGTSINPAIGTSLQIIRQPEELYHFLWEDEMYDPDLVERIMVDLQSNSIRVIRIWAYWGMVPSYYRIPEDVKANITDFLDRAHNHDLTVYFQWVVLVEPWMHTEYWKQTGLNWELKKSEYTPQGRAIVADYTKFLVEELFAHRDQPIIYSIDSENQVYPIYDEQQMRNDVIDYVNTIITAIRAADNRPDHLVTVELVQSDAGSLFPDLFPGFLWDPIDLYTSTALDAISMHFYHLDGSKTILEEFDECFGSWAPFSTKPIYIGELGTVKSFCDERVAGSRVLQILEHIRSTYDKITLVNIWSSTPYFKRGKYVFERADFEAPIYRLYDYYTGYSVYAAAVFYDKIQDFDFSSNYPSLTTNIEHVKDYSESSYSLIAHIPSPQEPNEITIQLRVPYKLHRIQVVDNVGPAPKDLDVYAMYNGQQTLLGSSRGNTPNNFTIDLAWTQEGGWIWGDQIMIRVYDEYANWGTLSEININPIDVYTELFLPVWGWQLY